jgi:hypothetical protein
MDLCPFQFQTEGCLEKFVRCDIIRLAIIMKMHRPLIEINYLLDILEY